MFVAGLAFGSFLNVCITRIPRDESVVAPQSHCRDCGKPIRWYDNVPVLSWLVLRGRCRQCGKPILPRYPAVEVLTAALFAACYARFGPNWFTLKFCIFSFLLVGLIFMDAETGLLPREFTYSGIVLGLGLFRLAPVDSSGTAFLLRLFQKNLESVQWLSLLDSALGAIAGGGFFYLAWALYYLISKRHGLGFGDVALTAMSGAFLGLKLVLLIIFCAPILGTLYAAALLVCEAFRPPSDAKNASSGNQPFLYREIPFGVFLGTCSLAAIFAGEAAWSWYLGLFSRAG